MTAVLDIVLPVFALVACGYGFGRGGLLPDGAARGIVAFVFNLAIPGLLFRAMAGGLPEGGIAWGLLGAYYGGCAAMYLVAELLGRLVFCLEPAERSVLGMGGSFSNIVMLGLPLAPLAYGEAGLVLAVLLVAFHSPLLIGATTLMVELRRGTGHAGVVVGSTLLALVKNPILIGLAAGALWGATGLDLPRPVERFVDLLAAAAAPSALFALGAAMTGFHIAGDLRESLTLVALKLVLHPLLVWLLATYLFALPPLEMQIAVMCAALPVGANVFLLAQRYELYVRRTATAVLLSTALSVVTLALLLALGPVPE